MEGKLTCGCTSKLKARGLCQKHYDVQRSLDKLIRSGDHCTKMDSAQQTPTDHKPIQVIPVSNSFLQTLSHKFNFKTTTHSRDVTCMLSPHITITSSPQHPCIAQCSPPPFHLPPLCIPSVSQILALQKTSIHHHHGTTITTTTTTTTSSSASHSSDGTNLVEMEQKTEEKQQQSVPLGNAVTTTTTSKTTTITVDASQQSIPDVSAATTSSTVLALILLSQSQSVDEAKKAEKQLQQQGYKCQIDGCKKEYITIQSLVGHSIECHGMGSNTSHKKRSMEHKSTSSRPTKKQKVKIK